MIRALLVSLLVLAGVGCKKESDPILVGNRYAAEWWKHSDVTPTTGQNWKLGEKITYFKCSHATVRLAGDSLVVEYK